MKKARADGIFMAVHFMRSSPRTSPNEFIPEPRINESVGMGGTSEPSSWLKAIYWWTVCLWNQFFISKCHFLRLCSADRRRCFAEIYMGLLLPSRGSQILIGVRGREDGWRLSGVGCQETGGGGGAATLFYVCVKMSHIGNGSSRMNSNPDTNRMLINRTAHGQGR